MCFERKAFYEAEAFTSNVFCLGACDVYLFFHCSTIERISEPYIVWGTVFVQTKRHSLP